MRRRFLVIVLFTIGAFHPIDCLWSSEGKTKSIGIVVNSCWKGERSFAVRLVAACKNLGWNATIIDSVLYKQFDWVFTLIPVKRGYYLHSRCPNYLVLFDPVNHYYDSDSRVKSEFCNYSGYLATFSENIAFSRNKNRCVYPSPWYPTAQYQPYRKLIPHKLFYFLGQWGNRYYDLEYKILEEKLAEQEYTCFFGNPDNGSKYGRAYKGEISYNSESIQNKISELGVCLVLHSDIHIDHAIPSGRLFEAVAAGSVIISDMNPFVQKHFGDSVLYVDQNRSGEEIFAQIDQHMRWILQNQEEAQAIAKSSYEIFCKNFILEDQLIRFDQWHNANYSVLKR